MPPGFLCAWTCEVAAKAVANTIAVTRNGDTILMVATRAVRGVGEDFGIIRCGTVGLKKWLRSRTELGRTKIRYSSRITLQRQECQRPDGAPSAPTV